VDGTPLTAGFAVAAGTITFTPSASVPAGLLQSSGTKEIVVTSANHGNATVSQAIAAGAATQLAVTTQPAAPASNGAALATQPVVTLRDQYNNTVTGSSASVTAAVGAGTWTLGGTTSVNASSGVVTFSGLTATSAAAVTGATINFTATGLTGATSGTFNIAAPDYVALTAIGTAATENFDTLANSSTSSTLPQGWAISESGSNANTTYSAGTGSGTTGDTYSFGASSSSERALGGLQTGSLNPSWGAKIQNNTGSTITTLVVSYRGETWRVGAANRSNRIDFQYSTDATSLTTGTWTDANSLDYANPGQATGSGSMQHSSAISGTITGLNIAAGATIWIRWTDVDVTGSDDGMAIDDFSIVGLGDATLSIGGSSANATSADFTTTYGTASAAQTFTIGGSSLQGDITATAGTGFEVSSDGTTYGPTATFTRNATYAASGTLHARLAANASASATYTSATVATLTSPNATSYSISTDSSGSAVSQKALTITGASATNRAYNSTTTVAVSGGSLSGVETGDTANVTLSAASASGTVASAAVGDGKVVTVTGYSISGSASSNYSLTQPTDVTVNITQKALTITGASATNRAYNSTTTVAVSGGSLSGVIGGDTVTLGGSPAGSIAAAGVGTNKAVTVTGFSISGADAGNYSVAQPTGLTVDITAKGLTVSAPTLTSSKAYDGNTTAAVTAGTLSGVESGDTVTVSASAAYDNASVGTGKTITVTYTLGGESLANYSAPASSEVTNGVITQKALTITGLTGANKVYDGNTTATATGTAALSGVESGDTVTLEGTPTFTFASANVGTGISISTTGYTLGGASAGNYSLTQPTLSANITAASQTITGLAAAQTRLAGAAAYSLAATASSGLTVSYASSDTAVATVAGSTVTIVGPGTTTITASQAGDGNYSAATQVTQTLTILPTTWTLIENFTGLNSGNLTGQNGWINSANTSGTVGTDPADSNNLVGVLQAGDQIQNYKNLAIAGPGQTATMFLRFRIGKIDNLPAINAESAGFMGVSDAATPTAFGNFRAQWGVNPTFSTTNTPNATTPFHLVSTGSTTNKFLNQQPADSIWYHAWVVLDKTNAKYSLYLQGGEFTTRTLVTEVSSNTSAFDFRNGGNLSDTETLKVYLRSGVSANHKAPLYVDDIYLASGQNLTPPVTPVHVAIVATGTAGSITRTTATITGNDVSADGNSAITERGVVYSTSANPTLADTKVAVSGTTGTFNASLTGLTGGTTYHVRAFATNAIGTAYGADVSFNTPANNLPTFAGMSVSTVKGSPVNILLTKVLAKASDADGDTVTVTAVTAATAQSGTATLGATSITYTPEANFSGTDTITFTLSDGFGTISPTITVTVSEDPLFTSAANAPTITSLEGGAKRIAFFGIPGRTYAIQRSTTMEAGSWTQIAAVTAAANSSVTFDDPNPPAGSAFYRIAYPAE
jgi:hypothetical protein